ncbi:MAG: glycosyltransferase family 4 protein [Flavobacteriaceae bacterium]|nr:glycosyltransferase family 4 protein [Flavobacteriaceae bacterium]
MKNVLIIGYVWPEPKSSAAGTRMLQLIKTFKNNNYEVVFVTPCAKSDNAFNLSSIHVKSKLVTLNDSRFDDFIIGYSPDIVIFDRFMMEEQFGWRVAEHCPDALRILDTEDLHSLRKGRHQAFKDNALFDKSYLYNDIAKREIASIYRSDLSLIISEVEAQFLVRDFKVDESLLHYLPFMQEEVTSQAISRLAKFENRKHFITIGNFLHAPNYNAVLYLKSHIWPLIRTKLPEAELHIYGAYISDKITQLHNKNQGFIIKGYAENVNTVMQSSKVCLAPIQFGAGLKGKLVDAMINGTPSVTTSIGAEGMFGELTPNGFVEDTPELFAEKAIALYLNENLWKSSQKAGFDIMKKRFLKGPLVMKFLSRLGKLQLNLESHRLNNFMGSMLQYHTMKSTKFMSRWIEEKNKNNNGNK